MISLFRKSSIVAAAALALGFALLPMSSAEARWRGHRGGYVAAGVLGGAILGGALLAPRAYGAPVYAPGPVYIDEEPECRVVRQRVWDDYRGQWVRVRRTICD